jgi:hypothetical protein
MATTPTVGGFLQIIWDDWRTLVSGGFSVPFTAIAVFSDSRYASLIWVVLALTALMFMTYWVLAREASRAGELEERLRPRINVRYDENISPCKSESSFTDGLKAECFRLEVENIGEDTIENCEGHLVEVRNINQPSELGVMKLTWADMPFPTTSVSLD